MASFRDTLNLPQTDFPMKGDLPRREPERLKWWAEHGLYAVLRAKRAGAPAFLLHDGPPYSNNHLHMGTAANKVWKDAVVRSASLLGFDAPYVPGWDNHGMPIEIQVGKEFRAKKLQPDRMDLRKRCRSYAAEWVEIQRDEFERLGIWGDWRRPYLTMDPAFEAEILETFAALAARGFIQRGLRSIHWCPTDRTALAEAEIEYQDDPSPSIHVAFPLRSDPSGRLGEPGEVSAIAWTTTPWTLPANLGLMVDPQATYVIAEAGGKRWLTAEARWPAVAEACGLGPAKIVKTLPGRDAIGAVFEGPWGNDSRVVDGTPFVSMSEGTGLVHTAPGHGKEDFTVGQRERLGIVSPVDEAGRFTEGAEPFVGRSVLEVNDDVIAWLKERGRLLGATTFTHSYPHCWRCRQPVIFRATKQWFMIIDHDGHRARALDAIENKVRWEPESSRNRIRDAVRLRPDWCLSRQRSWGVGIPAVYCEACDTAVLDPAVMRKAADRTRAEGSDAWYEHPVDAFLPVGFACPSCGEAGPFRKETDILDVWFDSGSTHRAIQVTHPELEPLWARAMAGAAQGTGGKVVYFEGPDQHRGWFNSSLMIGVGITGEAPYTDVLTHGWVLDAQGRAMHKSQGNVIAPEQIIVKYGADIVRWWALSTDWRTDVRIGDEILQRVSEAYRKVRNTFRFLLGNLHDFTPDRAFDDDQLTRIDWAFIDYLRARLLLVENAYRQFQFHRAADEILHICTVDLSACFLDIAKDRLYVLAASSEARRSAQTVLWKVLHHLCIAVSPLLTFTSEEIWQSHPSLIQESQSVHLADWPAELKKHYLGDAEWDELMDLRTAVNAQIEPLRAAKTVATTMEVEVSIEPRADSPLDHYATELVDFLMVAKVELLPSTFGATLDTSAPQETYRVTVRKTTQPKCQRCWTHREPTVNDEGLCQRCSGVLAATGRKATD